MAEERREIQYIQMGEELGTCPDCGYERGFHSMFLRAHQNGDVLWLLVCPECGAKFDAGLGSVSLRARGN